MNTDDASQNSMGIEMMNIRELKDSIKKLLMAINEDYNINNPRHRLKVAELKNDKEALQEFEAELEQERLARIQQLQAFYVWGAPGIGKSDLVEQLANELDISFRDVRLTTLDPVDLRGLPMVDPDEMLARWLPAGFLPKPDEKNGILFIDEINAVPPTMQASAYQLVLDKEVGEYKLPDGWIVMCASNRLSDRSVTHRLPKALANRFTHIGLHVNTNVWVDWAVRNEIDPLVINFIRSGLDPNVQYVVGKDDNGEDKVFTGNALFNFNPNSSEVAFATPRSWHFVSNLNYLRDIALDSYRALVVSTVGRKTGEMFFQFLLHREELPNPEDVLEGREYEMPRDYTTIYVFISMLSTALKNNLSTKRIDNYVTNFLMHFENTEKSDLALLGLKDVARQVDTSIFMQSKEASKALDRLLEF